jgi:PAS domain S-box-containing protein
METMILLITLASILLQLGATVLALRLIRTTKRTTAWLLLAAAIALMTVRRVVSLVDFLSGAPAGPSDLIFETVGLALSSLMFAGIYFIQPLFATIMRSSELLRAANLKLSAFSEEQRVLLEHTHDFIYRHDTGGAITYVSPAVERITGYSPSAWCAHYSAHYTDNEVNKTGIERTDEMLRTGKEGTSYRVEVKRKNGGTVWLEVNKQPYFVDNAVAGFIGIARDITRRVVVEKERENLIAELQDALASIKTLKGLLPICASCKKIRDDKGYWQQIEAFISEHSEAEFSHGICPECLQRLYPEHVDNKS